MGAVLLTAGAPGKRFALPNSRVMIHQPLAGMQGTAEEIMIHVNEYRQTKDKLNAILQKHTGRTMDEIVRDTDRDNFMSAEQAKAYGLVDQVVEKIS